MANSLERFENQLQGWIELNADRIGGKWELSSLAHLLVRTMENHLTKSTQGELMAPVGFIIRVNPISIQKWSNADEWLSKLTLVLQQVAVENNISFRSKPSLRIQPDPSQIPGKMDVTIEEPISFTDTVAIQVSNLKDAKSESAIKSTQNIFID